MDFAISKEKKKYVETLIRGNNPTVRKINKLKKVIFTGGISIAFTYVMLNLLIPSWSVAEINGVMAKDYEMITMFALFILIPTMVISFLVGYLAKELSRNNTLARINESLVVNGNQLRYTYRDVRISFPKERMEVYIDLSLVKDVVWNSSENSLDFIGDIDTVFFTDYRHEIIGRTDVIDNFVIHDYFTPSLKETLNINGINIRER